MKNQDDDMRDVIELDVLEDDNRIQTKRDLCEDDRAEKHEAGPDKPTPSQEPNIPNRSRKNSAHDGVFSNLAAKPEIMKLPTVGSDAPPPYTAAAGDLGSHDMFTGVGGHHGMEYDDLLYDDVEVGGFFTFFLYMIVSIFFEWIGFLVSILLSQSHAAKWGSWTGFGVTVALQSIQLSDYARNSAYWARHPDLLSGVSFLLTFGGYIIAISSLFSYFRIRAEASRGEVQSSSFTAVAATTV